METYGAQGTRYSCGRLGPETHSLGGPFFDGTKEKNMTDRYQAHDRAARMYSRLGESRKAVAHAKRARSLRFGAVPPVEVSLSLEAYAELAASRKRDTQLTDSHGGHWVAMSSGAMGVLMKQKERTLPETHPLHGIGPSLSRKSLRAPRGLGPLKSPGSQRTTPHSSTRILIRSLLQSMNLLPFCFPNQAPLTRSSR